MPSDPHPPTPSHWSEFDHVRSVVVAELTEAEPFPVVQYLRAAELAMILHDAAMAALRNQLKAVLHAN